MLMPMLSEADPKLSAEGWIDPLGMYAIADALAVRLVPGVRERQNHPRFLTSMAVSLSICSEFDDDTVAADEVSEPWQVYEWYQVEGMVRTTKEKHLLRGLPGQDKAYAAIKENVPLSANRYLKTATVFGFHGVYRALARDTEVERAGRLGEVGYDLLSAWEKDQGLQGFCGTADGPGKMIRRQLVEAVRDGLQKGTVARKAGWTGFQFFSEYLGIYEAGEREANIIAQALLNPGSGHRRPVFEALVGQAGRPLVAEMSDAGEFSERRFHELLLSRASGELVELLKAIDVYERFCRYLQDAFDDCLHRLSQYQRRLPPSMLADLPGVKTAANQVPAIYCQVAEKLAPFGEAIRFQEAFNTLAESLTSEDWLVRLLEHHRRVQRNKPPAGKAPWFDYFDDGSYMVRTAYLREAGGRQDDSYVHAYRTGSLWSFARDLRLVQ